MIYFIISLTTYFTYLVFKGKRYLSYFIEQKYNLKKIKLFNIKKFLTLELLGVILVVLTFFLNSKTVGILFIIFYMILSLIEIKNSNLLKIDKTAKKTIFITIIIYLAVFIIIFFDYFKYQQGFIFYDRVNYYYIIVFILGYLEYIIIYLSLKINKKIK